MAVSLNTNISAMSTERRLAENTTKLTKSFERLSSGLRINRAGDDAAGLAISESLRSDSRVFSQGLRNLNDGISVTNIADSSLNEMSNIVTRLQELAEQAANGTLSNQQRSSLDAEAQALSKEYFRVSRVAEFNGLKLFDGNIQTLRLQAGYGESGSLSSTLGGQIGTGLFDASAVFTPEVGISKSVELADFNNDGYVDMVSGGNTFTGYITVRLGAGDGSFSPAVSYQAESGATHALAVTDVNSDGLTDIVSAGSTAGPGWDGGATIFLGRGDGTFQRGMSYVMEGSVSRSVALGDLNGDSILDLVTAGGNGAGAATIRLGRGDGTFGAAYSYASEVTESYALSLADLNGDSILDLVTAGDSSGVGGFATVRLGVGDGTFGARTSYAMDESYTRGLALADLNADGNLDMVSAGRNAAIVGTATIRFGQGDGTFSQAVSYTSGNWSSYSVAVDDMNGDSFLDLVTAGPGGRVDVRLGAGNGRFDSSLLTGCSLSYSNGIATGDLNADGVSDVAVVGDNGSGAGQAQTFLNRTRAGVSPLQSFSLKTRADALHAIPLFRQANARVASQRGTIGALQSRLNTALANLQVARENYDAARSQITDVDVASESSALLRNQIVQQAASSILGQANQTPALALSLLRA